MDEPMVPERPAGLRAAVFAPALGLSVTVETDRDAGAEIHLHASGQGFWIARLMVELGARTTMVGPVGGEVGPLLEALVTSAAIDLRGVRVAASNGAYVHDRRGGQRQTVAEMPPAGLSRHDADDLYGAALVEGLSSQVCVLSGPGVDAVVEPDLYRRLAADLRANAVPVVADLSGACTDAVLDSGLSVLKTSADDLRHDLRLSTSTLDGAVACARDLAAAGADAVIVTRAQEGAVVVHGDDAYLLEAPLLHPVEHRGAGDSLTAGLAVGFARGWSFADAVGLGAAAGALNVTRRGLGSGSREDIERMARRVVLTPLDGG